METRDAAVVEDVVAHVRAALQGAAPAWGRALVRFEVMGGCFSTRVLHGAGERLEPLDAVRHQPLFLRLQALGRQLSAVAGRRDGACDVEIGPRSHRTR